MVERCKICWKPVGMRPEHEANRMFYEDGVAHRRCVPVDEGGLVTAHERFLQEIFGAPNRAPEGRKMVAAELGHVTTIQSRAVGRTTGTRAWSCTCGATGTGESAKNEHERMAILLGPDAPA